MKNITKDQIEETITKMSTKVSENVTEILIDNIRKYENGIDEIGGENMKQYCLYIATMNTALQMSVTIMKESLYELLCDE